MNALDRIFWSLRRDGFELAVFTTNSNSTAFGTSVTFKRDVDLSNVPLKTVIPRKRLAEAAYLRLVPAVTLEEAGSARAEVRRSC